MKRYSKHHSIVTFSIVGIIGDDIINERDKAERRLSDDMRDEGYVPLLDIIPSWSTRIRSDGKNYDYHLMMAGFYVGDDVWEVAAISNWKQIPMSPAKLKPRLDKSE